MRSFAILVAMFIVTVGSETNKKATGLRTFEDDEQNIEHAIPIQIVESEERMIVEEEIDISQSGVRTCSGHDFNEMNCSCLQSAYNYQLSCSGGLTYKSTMCATYNHHCTTKPAGKKRDKLCCRAVLCYLDKLGC